jgi:hypothetical protein
MVEVHARLVYANDGDPVPSASVTVDALGPDGTTVPAVPMVSQGNGAYTAELNLPGAGRWTVRAASTSPDAAAEVGFEAVQAATTTTTTTPARQTIQDDPLRDESDRDGSRWVTPAVIGLLALLGIALVAWLWRRRSAPARQS